MLQQERARERPWCVTHCTSGLLLHFHGYKAIACLVGGSGRRHAIPYFLTSNHWVSHTGILRPGLLWWLETFHWVVQPITQHVSHLKTVHLFIIKSILGTRKLYKFFSHRNNFEVIKHYNQASHYKLPLLLSMLHLSHTLTTINMQHYVLICYICCPSLY